MLTLNWHVADRQTMVTCIVVPAVVRKRSSIQCTRCATPPSDRTESHATLVRRFRCYTFFLLLSVSVTRIRSAFALLHYKTHYSIYSLNFKMARDRKFVTMYRTQRTTAIDVDMASTKTLNACSAWSGDVYSLPVRRCAHANWSTWSSVW